jgi:regulator of RNase E activity RraA
LPIGVRGYVVDGGCRDSAFIEKLGFPVFCRYYTPVDIVGKWQAHAYGERINIGGVSIDKDDFLIADRDGIVIIPKAVVPEVVQKVEEVLQSENQVRSAILKGVDPVEAYLKFGKF